MTTLAPAEDSVEGRDSDAAKFKRRATTWFTKYVADQHGYRYKVYKGDSFKHDIIGASMIILSRFGQGFGRI